jgi:hypothetical protein
MRENILLVCLVASALVNFWLLWLCSRWSKFAGILQKQCDEAHDTILWVQYKAER